MSELDGTAATDDEFKMSEFGGAAATDDEFKDLYPQLMHWARLMGIDADDIDDVVQSTCVEVWRRSRDHEIVYLEGYARTVLRHTWLARLQVERRRAAREMSGNILLQYDRGDGGGLFEELEDERADVEKQVWRREELVEVRERLKALPRPYGLIIQGLIEGKKSSELAHELRTSTRWVRRLARRARELLRTPIILDEAHVFWEHPDRPDSLPERPEPEEVDWRWEGVREVYRQVLDLRMRQGLSVAQIAARLHYSEGTVRCYLSRGKREAEAPHEVKQQGRPRQETPACWEWIDQVSPIPQHVLRLYYEQHLSVAAIAVSEEMLIEGVRDTLKQGRRELQRLGKSTSAVPGSPRTPLTPLQQQYLPEKSSGVYLSVEQRDVWQQYYKDRKTTRAIAENLKIPEGTVKSRLRLARGAFANAAAG